MKKKGVCMWVGGVGDWVEDRWQPSACYFSSVALVRPWWLHLFAWHVGLTDWWGHRRSLINKSVVVHLSLPRIHQGWSAQLHRKLQWL